MKKYLFFASAGTLLTAVVLLSAAGASAQQKKKAGPSVNSGSPVRGPYQLVIDFGSPGDEAWLRDWNAPVDETELYNRGKSNGLAVNPDKGPVKDGKARVITQYGSHVNIAGLGRSVHYWMWVDVVTYRNLRGADFPVNLDIYVDSRMVRTVSFADMTGDMDALMIELPYDLTQDGEVDVIFRERSHYFGIWGIWDVIVRDSPYLPAKLEAPAVKTVEKNMGVKERIIEERPKVKKLEGKPAKKAGEPAPGKEPDGRGGAIKKEGVKKEPEGARAKATRKEAMKEKQAPAKKKLKGKSAGKEEAAGDRKLLPKEDSGSDGSPMEKKDDARGEREKKMDEPGKTVEPYIPKDPAVPVMPDIKNEHGEEKDGKK